MDAIQRAVVAPQVEIVEKCAARRQIFRDRTPLASRAQNIHDPVHHFAHLDMALVAAALGGRDQWFDMRPFIVGQVTRISQFAAVVTSAVLRRPHRGAPLESGHHFESQTIQRIQNVFGRTLREFKKQANLAVSIFLFLIVCVVVFAAGKLAWTWWSSL
jgi:hypothetical protein